MRFAATFVFVIALLASQTSSAAVATRESPEKTFMAVATNQSNSNVLIDGLKSGFAADGDIGKCARFESYRLGPRALPSQQTAASSLLRGQRLVRY